MIIVIGHECDKVFAAMRHVMKECYGVTALMHPRSSQ